MRLKVVKMFLLSAIVTILGSMVSVTPGRGNLDFTVCLQGCAYSQIQAAVDDANSGATILIDDGIYKENLIISKNLRLVGTGTGKVVLKQPNLEKPAIQIKAQNPIQVYVTGLTIGEAVLPNEYTNPLNNSTGIAVAGRAQVLLERITISGQWLGIVGHQQIEGTKELGNVLIQESTISHNLCGIFITSAVQVYQTKIIGNSVGICGGGNFTVAESTISENLEVGISVVFPSVIELEDLGPVKILNNLISKNGNDGIRLRSMPHSPELVSPSQEMAIIRTNQLVGNKGFGIAIYNKICTNSTPFPESGPLVILGWSNEMKANEKGNLCPADYAWPPGFVKP